MAVETTKNPVSTKTKVSGVSNPLIEELRIQGLRYWWYSIDENHRLNNSSIPESLNSKIITW